MRGSESYRLLESLSDVGEVNSLIGTPLVDGLKLDMFGGDYKVGVWMSILYMYLRYFSQIYFFSFYSLLWV